MKRLFTNSSISAISKNTWLFVILAGVLFAQFILGHIEIYHSILISSLWRDTATFFNFYIPRLLIACAIAVWVYFAKHKWWVIAVPALVDVALWCIIPAHTFSVLDVCRELLIGGIVWPYIKFRNTEYKPIVNDRTAWIIALSFCASVIIQCLIFHFSIFYNYEPPTMLDHVMLYVSKISIAVLLSSIVLFFKRSWWVIVASVTIDVWIFSELIYFRANGFFLDPLAVTMVDNMNGWWDTVPMYIHKTDWWVLAPTILITCVVIYFKKHEKDKSGGVALLSIGILLSYISIFGFQAHQVKKILHGNTAVLQLNPFAEDVTRTIVSNGDIDYLRKFSVVHAFFYDTFGLIYVTCFENNSNLLTEADKQMVDGLINPNIVAEPSYKSPVIICLVESMENWAICPEVTPNICKLMEEHREHILYAERVASQVRSARSADGQMIVNTGMLPVEKGAVCFRYYMHQFPSISEIYKDKSCGLFPHDLSVWNQGRMSETYHFKDNYVTTTSDEEIFTKVVSLAPEYDYILAVTSSTHTPFTEWANVSSLQTPNGMPANMANYLKSMWCLDNGLGCLLSQIEENEKLKNTTIVITGDHTVFNTEDRREFAAYCHRSGDTYQVNEDFCPLIVYSPTIESYTHVVDTTYQMDIYPTILSAIGCEDYYWKGFGVNLANMSIIERKVDQRNAVVLSDKIIRQNYLKTVRE